MNTSNMLKNKHLSYKDRKTIEKSLNNSLNFSQIGSNINKPYKTISNEIKRNRIFEASTAFSLCGSKLFDKLNKPHMFVMVVLLKMDVEEKILLLRK